MADIYNKNDPEHQDKIEEVRRHLWELLELDLNAVQKCANDGCSSCTLLISAVKISFPGLIAEYNRRNEVPFDMNCLLGSSWGEDEDKKKEEKTDGPL